MKRPRIKTYKKYWRVFSIWSRYTMRLINKSFRSIPRAAVAFVLISQFLRICISDIFHLFLIIFLFALECGLCLSIFFLYLSRRTRSWRRGVSVWLEKQQLGVRFPLERMSSFRFLALMTKQACSLPQLNTQCLENLLEK